jgi:hypothetical protein
LSEFVDSHLTLSSTLQTAKAEMEAAAKAAQEAAKKSVASKSRINSKTTTSPNQLFFSKLIVVWFKTHGNDLGKILRIFLRQIESLRSICSQ